MESLEGFIGTIAKISVASGEMIRLLGAQNMPYPTLDEEGHDAFKGEDTALRQARYTVARAAHDLLRLVQGPEDHILQLAWASGDTANLAVLLHFHVPDNIPLDGSASASDLCSKVGLPLEMLLRTLRYSVGSGLFVEQSAGVFAHNAASATLARNEPLRDIAMASTHELSRMLLSLPDTLDQQQQKGPEGPEAAFNLVFPQYPNIFACLANEPELAKRYHLYMVGRTNTDRWSAANMVKSWDWKHVGAKTIVDVGGSAGQTCMALSGACPDAKFIIQDVDAVALKHGEQALMANAPSLSSRVSFVQHDFFQPQTVSGDVYIFRHIFHDWNDEDTVRILKALVPGLKSKASILVSEGVVPPPPAKRANVLDDKQILIEDMFMQAVHNGRERTVQEFIDLFKKADDRYKYIGTSGGVDGAFQSIVEFCFEG